MSEAAKTDEAQRLLRHIEDQIDKRQYLNAAVASVQLTQALLAAFSAVTRPAPEVTSDMVRRLHERVGCSLHDSLFALRMARGDEERAIQILREGGAIP